MEKKQIYESPRVINLSAFSASGQQVHPTGQCTGGPYPYTDCVAGPSFEATCGGGSAPDTSACNAGSFHSSPTCNPGANAATICMSGGSQN